VKKSGSALTHPLAFFMPSRRALRLLSLTRASSALLKVLYRTLPANTCCGGTPLIVLEVFPFSPVFFSPFPPAQNRRRNLKYKTFLSVFGSVHHRDCRLFHFSCRTAKYTLCQFIYMPSPFNLRKQMSTLFLLCLKPPPPPLPSPKWSGRVLQRGFASNPPVYILEIPEENLGKSRSLLPRYVSSFSHSMEASIPGMLASFSF